MLVPYFRILAAMWIAAASTSARAADDIVIADFEGKDYGSWKVTGEAFGPGPAQGTLPNQMHVSGFLGKGLVNSFHKGDVTTGTLTSPPIKLDRKYINFLIGGGGHREETIIQLIVADKVVRKATGPNTKAGGSEQLDWHSWDVQDLAGKEAVIRITDNGTGGWGHINVDHITLSDKQPPQPVLARRQMRMDKEYLWLPVKNGAAKRTVKFFVGDQRVREFEIELAEGKPDWWAYTNVSAFRGKTLTIDAGKAVDGDKLLASLANSDMLPPDLEDGHEARYRNKLRPQFHFTSRRGWLNDPNGLVYHQGEWHLYYQHNPFGWAWGNMHWGHAVSKDLLHWQELGDALYPHADAKGAVFSGSAVIDHANTAGWKKEGANAEDVLVAAYTDTGAGESIAYSLDRGRTFTQFAGNPVVKHQGRDPKLIWHEATKRWVMAVYTEAEGKQWIAFHTSPDLKAWKYESRIEGFFECPDLFPLTATGNVDRARTMWVLYAADGQYVLGSFDGREFKKESPANGKHRVWYGNFYAAQTYDNAPPLDGAAGASGGRRVQIGWGQGIEFKGMPFNQQMVIPVELTLRTAADGLRMYAEPVREVAALRKATDAGEKLKLAGGDKVIEHMFKADAGELLDIEAELAIEGEAIIAVIARGVPVVYDAKKQTLTCRHVTAPVKLVEGKLKLRVLVDRGSVEVFVNDGAAAMSVAAQPAEKEHSVKLSAQHGAVSAFVKVHELKSVWE